MDEKKFKVCPYCEGKRIVPNPEYLNDYAMFTMLETFIPMYYPCPVCDGKGEVPISSEIASKDDIKLGGKKN